MMTKKRDPNIWITIIKLLIGALVLIFGVGWLLEYVDMQQRLSGSQLHSTFNWGIKKDSPFQFKR